MTKTIEQRIEQYRHFAPTCDPERVLHVEADLLRGAGIKVTQQIPGEKLLPIKAGDLTGAFKANPPPQDPDEPDVDAEAREKAEAEAKAKADAAAKANAGKTKPAKNKQAKPGTKSTGSNETDSDGAVAV